MRRFSPMHGLWLALVCLALIAPDAQGQFVPQKGKITVLGHAGFAQLQLDDVNDLIKSEERELRMEQGALAEFDEFTGDFDLGAGLMYQVASRLSVGVEFSYLKSTLANKVFWEGFALLEDAEAWVKDISFTAYYWPPLDDGLFIGAGVGAGWSYQRIDREFINSTNHDDDILFVGDWTGSGLAASGFLGYQFRFQGDSVIFLRGGYSLRNMGKPEGPTTASQNGVTSEVTTVFQDVDWDFSGFYFRIGVGYGLPWSLGGN